ncbi:MAG: ribonuclease Y [Candidatus Pacebacteria bacterium]|nr:ribonuclease Y [Candidatus Paceibacterota bacterium]
MSYQTILGTGVLGIVLGSILGYFARATILKKRQGTIERNLKKKIESAKAEAEKIITRAHQRANQIIRRARKEEIERRKEILETEKLLAKRERILQAKITDTLKKEKELQEIKEEVRKLKEEYERKIEEEKKKLQKIAGLSEKKAREELIKKIEESAKKELLEKLRYLEEEGRKKLEERAQKILADAIQKYALSQAQETTVTTVALPSDKVKGRIIGKEGRNIKAFEKLTGVEVVIDDTPEVVVLSSFSPIRRYIAKLALERLIEDGRIQPARIEEIIKKTEEGVKEEIRKAGEAACYDTGVIDLPPKLIELLGRLKFRTSFGQNVLLHSIEVAYLAGALAAEIGADVKIAKKAGLLHDIGKALDQQVEGSHTQIGMKILEKFGIEKEVIDAMKSHHEEYPHESVEAQIVQVADQISGARPGARKDTLENYLKRLEELENIALSFKGVEKAYAIQAGREIRVFVSPEEIDDYQAYKLAKDISQRIREELNYPGEIKVVVIREKRVVEYAR